MPNNTRIRDDSTWSSISLLGPDEWTAFERNTFGSWNGDRGGAYAGAAPHIIGGAGLQVEGPTRLTAGGMIKGASSAFVIPNGTWPTLATTHSGRTRRILQVLSGFRSPNSYLWTRHPTMCGIGSVALSCRLTYTRLIDQAEMYVPLRVIDGSTLTSVEIRFRIMTERKEAPRGMPRFRILRIPRDIGSASIESLVATADGFFVPALVTSPTEWYAAGAVKSVTIPCSILNLIDVSTYSYMVHIVEEVGTSTVDDDFDGYRLVERKPDAFIRYQTVPTILGTKRHGAAGRVYGIVWGDDVDVPADPLVPNDFGTAPQRIRLLILDDDSVIDSGELTNDSANVGIWNITTDAAFWKRAADLDSPEDFSPNWIVRCLTGWRDAGTVWQCQYPTSKHKIIIDTRYLESTVDPRAFPPPVPEDLTRIRVTPPTIRGNLYHALIPTFSVADLRFQ